MLAALKKSLKGLSFTDTGLKSRSQTMVVSVVLAALSEVEPSSTASAAVRIGMGSMVTRRQVRLSLNSFSIHGLCMKVLVRNWPVAPGVAQP